MIKENLEQTQDIDDVYFHYQKNAPRRSNRNINKYLIQITMKFQVEICITISIEMSIMHFSFKKYQGYMFQRAKNFISVRFQC